MSEIFDANMGLSEASDTEQVELTYAKKLEQWSARIINHVQELQSENAALKKRVEELVIANAEYMTLTKRVIELEAFIKDTFRPWVKEEEAK